MLLNIESAGVLADFFRVGGMARDVTDEWIQEALELLDRIEEKSNEYNTLLTYNKVFRERTVGEGCDTGLRVERWLLLGAGHTWAGGLDEFGGFLGGTTSSISATESVLDFFDSSHRSAP